MPEIKKYIEGLIESGVKLQLNVPYLNHMGNHTYKNFIETAIEFFGKPIDISQMVAYFEVDASRFYECIDKGCPCCGKDKLRYLGFPPSRNWRNTEYAEWPGAYDLPGVMPKMGCRSCRLYIGVDESWLPEDYLFKYHINERVRMINDMEASITKVIDEHKFIVDIDYPDGVKTETTNYEDIKHIIRRYE